MPSEFPSLRRWIMRLAPLLLLNNPASAKQPFELMVLANNGAPSRTTTDNSGYPAVSADGQYVTFVSSADDLVATATTLPNIFLRASGRTALISADSDGKEGKDVSGEISDVSDDGCVVAFETAASLVKTDTNGVKDIYLRRRSSSSGKPCKNLAGLFLVSKNTDGAPLTTASSHPDLSGNGQFVAYENEEKGIVWYDIAKSEAVEVTEGQAGQRPAISNDGSRVAFYSAAALIPTDKNGSWDIYLWDKSTKAFSLVSTASDGAQQDAGNDGPDRITEPAISGDGSFVSFASSASNLVTSDTNGAQDVFIKNVKTKELVRVSVTPSGEQGNGDSPGELGGRAAMSNNGTWVVFESKASNLTGGTGDVARTVLRNLSTGETIALDATGSGGSGKRPAISNDDVGRFVAFYSANPLDSRFESAGIFRYDRHKVPVAVAAIDPTSPSKPNPGDTVILDGSGSSNEVNAGFAEPGKTPELRYQWAQAYPAAAAGLTGSETANPNFTPTKKGSYLFQLTVSDDFESSEPAELVVQVGTHNRPPVADAGSDPAGAETKSVVRLDGRRSSDPEGRRLQYFWRPVSSQSTTTVQLFGSNPATPTFIPDIPGTYTFSLRVFDGRYLSDPPSIVTVTVAKGSTEGLVANPGEDAQDQLLGQRYQLDGSGSRDTTTGNSDGLSYSWKILSAPSNPSDRRARFRLRRPHSAQPSFVPPLPGTYLFGLTVEKGGKLSAEKPVKVTVGGSIDSIDRPARDEAWIMGGSEPSTVVWQYAGIAPKQRFVVLLYSFRGKTPSGPCLRGCLLDQGIKAGRGNRREISIPLSKAKVLSGYGAQIAVCIPGIGRNEPLCKRSAAFNLE